MSDIRNFDEEKINDYAIKVHGIKGASLDVFAGEVGEKARALEYAAEIGDLDYIHKFNTAFIDTLQAFLDSLDELLSGLDMQGHKQEKEKPDDNLLAELLEHCKNYNLDGAERVMKEIDKYRYTADDGLADKLQEHIEMTDLPEIERILIDRGI